MELTTKVALPKTCLQLAPSAQMLLVGSCFARHIGTKFLEHGLKAAVNPFGVLYNPESIALALECALGKREAEDYNFEGRDGLWHNWLFSGEVSAGTEAELTATIRQRIAEAKAYLSGGLLCITFGTAQVYGLKEEGCIVGNCHKEAASRFATRRLDVEEITARWSTLLKDLRTFNPALQILLTVSPYRYAGYGLHENTLSKATLHLAVAALQETFPQCHYFPAYEIVIDELRDYRFYDADMLHPSAVAVDYIWERFSEWCFTPETKEYIKDYATILRDRRHRPLHPESEEYKRFLAQAGEREAKFREKWASHVPMTCKPEPQTPDTRNEG